MSSFKDELLKIPPVTRFLCASTLAVTLPVILKLISPFSVIYTRQLVLTRFEFWRLFTTFFLGSSGINFIFDFVMLYRNSESLESGHFAGRSADYAWQLFLASAGILALSTPLYTMVHTRPLLVALTYLGSALAPPGTQTSILGLISIPVQYMPYVLVGLDLIMGGPRAAAEAVVGCVAGHIWWWLVFGRAGSAPAWAGAPGWLRRLVGNGRPAGSGGVGGVHVIPPRTRAAQSGQVSSSGYQWGSGHRLGNR